MPRHEDKIGKKLGTKQNITDTRSCDCSFYGIAVLRRISCRYRQRSIRSLSGDVCRCAWLRIWYFRDTCKNDSTGTLRLGYCGSLQNANLEYRCRRTILYGSLWCYLGSSDVPQSAFYSDDSLYDLYGCSWRRTVGTSGRLVQD